MKNRAFYNSGDTLAIPFAADQYSAKKTTGLLSEDIGFDLVYIGSVAKSTVIQPGAKVYVKEATK